MNVQELCGWINNPEERDRIAAMQPIPCFGDAADSIKGSGKGLDVFLWQCEEAVTGKDVRDPNNQTIGDCVSHGTGQGCEDLEYVQMYDATKNGGELGEFRKVATEVIYGGGRIEIGRGGCGFGDGLVVGWAIDWCRKFGVLARGVYGDIDLTTYDGKRARAWGRPLAGVPDSLEPEAKKYPLVTASLIEGPDFYTQAIDALANQCLIVTGSNQLYSQKRGDDGFITPQGRGGHCTYYRGFTDNGVRPGIFYQNSWSKAYHVGPQIINLPGRNQQLKIPYGGGFIDADAFNKMHKGQEVWAISKLTAYNPKPAPAPVYTIKLY